MEFVKRWEKLILLKTAQTISVPSSLSPSFKGCEVLLTWVLAKFSFRT